MTPVLQNLRMYELDHIDQGEKSSAFDRRDMNQSYCTLWRSRHENKLKIGKGIVERRDKQSGFERE
jgi:hypothetical protein